MRVLFITAEFPPMQGGVGDCTYEIALAIAHRGVQVSILTTRTQSLVSGLQSFDWAQDRSPGLNILPTIERWDWSALSQIRRTIAEIQPDIYHIQYQTGAFHLHPMINFAPRLFQLFPPSPELRFMQFGRGGRGVRQEGGVRSVVTFHDLRPMYLFPKAGPLRDWVTFQLARTTDAVIATNEDDYTRLASQNPKSLDLIPIGSNINPAPPPGFDRAQLRAQLGVGPDETLLCYFGFLNDSKGGETLMRALAHIPNAKLVMLGGQTGASDATNVAYLEHVKKIIADLGLDSRVLWTDFLTQPEVSAHFLASDVCVLPYRDGASYRRGTFMAALAHGSAIITTYPPRPLGEGAGGRGLPALRDGENVLLVPPDDPAAIAAAIQRLAASPALAARLRQGARDTARFFTWDKIADAHVALYDQLLST